MAKAKKLPSGQWRTLVYSHTDADGHRHYESFTANTKKESEYQAAEFALKKDEKQNIADISFGQAFDRYIEKRSSILSPNTVREYTRIRNHDLKGIMDIKLSRLTQEQIQSEINMESLSHSPKTVRNMHGIISAILATYRPDFRLHTALPQKIRPALHIPTEEEVKELLNVIRGTDLEIPVLLAAFGPMRRGEICALESDHINGNVVHVEFSMAKDKNKNWVIKTTKTYSGNRYITYPDFVIERIKGIEGRIVDTNPDALSSMFARRMRKSKMEHFRFHDLRHYAASIMHAIGIPDQYIMERGGWATDLTLKSVYRHTMQDRNKDMIQKTNEYFSTYATQNATQK